MIKKLNIYLFLLLLLTFSCIKDVKRPQWDVDVLFPIAHTSLNITNLIPDSLVSVKNDSSLSLVYNSDVFSVNFDSLFKIPDTTINQMFSFPIGGFKINPGTTIINQTEKTKYNLQGAELTYVLIKSGSIDVQLISSFPEKTVLTYQIPLAKKSGQYLNVSDTLPPASLSNPVTISKSIDLSGYEIDLRSSQMNSYNTIESYFNATTCTCADTFTVTSGDYVQIKTFFNTVVPELARGYFGKHDININSSADTIRAFKNFSSGIFSFEKVFLSLNIKNGIGADVRGSINTISSINTKTGNNVSLTGPLINSTFNINRATENGTGWPPVIESKYSILLNETNTNFNDFLSNLPDFLSYDMNVSLNPLGNISNGKDFVYYNKGLEVELNLEIPLSLSASNLILLDTISFNIVSEKDKENPPVNGNILMNIYNGYPLKILPQLYLLAADFTITDSLIASGNVFDAAPINSQGIVINPIFSQLKMPVDNDKMDKLKNASFMLIKLALTTQPANNYIKIYSNYSADVKVTGDFNYTIK
jgi:hypothetical protein